MIRTTFQKILNLIINMYKATLALNYFPDTCKEEELVYFGKWGKPVDNPSGNQPLTFLQIYGKICEKF